MAEETKLKDLGWGNGWGGETPPEVLACSRARLASAHDYSDVVEAATGAHRVVCRTCGYTYQYDSGD